MALDFDYEHNCLYWADVTLDIIQVSREQGAITSLPPLVLHPHPEMQMFVLVLLPSLSVT